MIPTYNEKENIKNLINKILKLKIKAWNSATSCKLLHGFKIKNIASDG